MLAGMRTLVLIFLVGCGGDKLTSIAESKKLSELSPDDMKKLCEDMKTYRAKKKVTDDPIKISCNAEAVMTVARSDAKDDAALRAECKKAVETCLAKMEKIPAPKDLDCNDKKFSAEMSRCDATVGEFVGCVDDINAVMKKKFASDAACGQLKADEKDGIFDRMKIPKCDALEKCKNLWGVFSNKEGGMSGDGGDSAFKEALAKFGEFKTQMCECKDKACGNAVSEAMTKWGTEPAKTASKDSRPDAATAKKISDTMAAYTECMTKVMTAPAPAPTPP